MVLYKLRVSEKQIILELNLKLATHMYSKRKWVKTWKKYIELTISFACKIQQGRWLRFQTQVHIPLQCQSRQQIHCNFHFFLRNFCLCRWYILSLKLSARNYNDNQWVQASSIWYSFFIITNSYKHSCFWNTDKTSRERRSKYEFRS